MKKRGVSSEVDPNCAREGGDKGEANIASPKAAEAKKEGEETRHSEEGQKRRKGGFRITADDVEKLIVDAQSSAAAVQGSDPAWRLGDPHNAGEFDDEEKKGSDRDDLDSRLLHEKVQQRVPALLAERGKLMRVVDLCGPVVDVLKILEKKSCCRSKVQGRKG